MPHLTIPGAIYNIVFHLEGSIPADVMTRLKKEAEAYRQNIKFNSHQKEMMDYFLVYDECISQYNGDFLLDSEECFEAVKAALRKDYGTMHLIHCFCIMPNHLHLMIEPLPGYDLTDIMSLIRITAAQGINEVLGRGNKKVFSDDYFNRIVRSVSRYYRQEQYIWDNPGQHVKDYKGRWSILNHSLKDVPTAAQNHFPVSSRGIIVGFEDDEDKLYPLYKGQKPNLYTAFGCYERFLP